jgi:hypothetical protein
MNKSVVRVYTFNPSMYIKTDDTGMDSYVPKCNTVVLQKIGFDENDRPLYNLLVGDGRRSIEELGYVVPVGTKPAKSIDDVKEPECVYCMMSEDAEDGDTMAGSGCTGDCCW